MEPKFHDGDTVLIRQQPAVDVGEVGLFIVDGKGFIKKQGPDHLISLNPESKDIWPGEYSDVRCVGKVRGVLEPEWIYRVNLHPPVKNVSSCQTWQNAVNCLYAIVAY